MRQSASTNENPADEIIASLKEEKTSVWERGEGDDGWMDGWIDGGGKRTDCPVTVEAALILGEIQGVPDATRLHVCAQDLVHGHAGHAASCLGG